MQCSAVTSGTSYPFPVSGFVSEHAARFMSRITDVPLCYLRVSEAAEQAGFHDPLYFSRLFRRKYGLSPVSFRRRVETGVLP